jgi:hypothetical protein
MALPIWVVVIASPENDNSRRIISHMSRRRLRLPDFSDFDSQTFTGIAAQKISIAAWNPSCRAAINLASSAFWSLISIAARRSVCNFWRYAVASSIGFSI